MGKRGTANRIEAGVCTSELLNALDDRATEEIFLDSEAGPLRKALNMVATGGKILFIVRTQTIIWVSREQGY